VQVYDEKKSANSVGSSSLGNENIKPRKKINGKNKKDRIGKQFYFALPLCA